MRIVGSKIRKEDEGRVGGWVGGEGVEVASVGMRLLVPRKC